VVKIRVLCGPEWGGETDGCAEIAHFRAIDERRTSGDEAPRTRTPTVKVIEVEAATDRPDPVALRAANRQP